MKPFLAIFLFILAGAAYFFIEQYNHQRPVLCPNGHLDIVERCKIDGGEIKIDRYYYLAEGLISKDFCGWAKKWPDTVDPGVTKHPAAFKKVDCREFVGPSQNICYRFDDISQNKKAPYHHYLVISDASCSRGIYFQSMGYILKNNQPVVSFSLESK